MSDIGSYMSAPFGWARFAQGAPVDKGRGEERMNQPARDYWNGQAANFDDAPDHGLQIPEVRAAWLRLLVEYLPVPPAEVIDLGCGTGSLSVLLAQEGYTVRGLDVAEEMITVAAHKAGRAGVTVDFAQGDAASPPYLPGSCDVVLSRHVLWTMPDPGRALDVWIDLLRPGGLLVLIEGRWSTGAGITAMDCERLVRSRRADAVARHLHDEHLWGGPITDERYILVSSC